MTKYAFKYSTVKQTASQIEFALVIRLVQP